MYKNLVSFCLMFFIGVGMVRANTIQLKSARSVTAEITENTDKKTVQIIVCFIPVSSLDSLNNERMNLVISRFFVEQALSQFYGKEKSVDFLGVKPVLSQREKQRKTFCYTVPYAAISDAVVRKEVFVNKITHGYSQNLDEDIFLSALEIFNRDLMLAESCFLKEINEKKDKKELKKNINRAFEALKIVIKKQDDLLSAEKEDFISKTNKVQRYLLKKLQETCVLSPSEPTDSVSGISNYTFHPEFKEILQKDRLLLEFGGCKAFRLSDGRIILVGIGMAEVKNNSAQDRIFRRKIAELRAFAALAEHEEVDVSSFSQLSDSATITTVDKKEKGNDQRTISSESTVRAKAYFKNMETVGVWYSKDGKLFFLAKGCFISPK